MQGQLSVTSEVGKGSCFSFDIRVDTVDAIALTDQSIPVSDTHQQLPSPLDPNLAKRLPLSILVAEDNLVNQQLVEQWLSKMGYGCTVVDNGQKVVAALQAQSYDLVLMDVQMPEVDASPPPN